MQVCRVFDKDALQVLIVSYETFRLHAEKFRGEGACDLLICDEAHRLKNDQTLTNKVPLSLAQQHVKPYVAHEWQESGSAVMLCLSKFAGVWRAGCIQPLFQLTAWVPC